MPTGVIDRPGLRPAAYDDSVASLPVGPPPDLGELLAGLGSPREEAREWSEAVLAWAAGQPSGDQVARQLIAVKRAIVDSATGRQGRERAAQVAAALDSVLPAAVAVASQRALDRALTDPLTGLRSRRRLDDELHAALKAAERAGTPLTVALLDVDGLKRINDTLGHPAGDDLLRALGCAIRATLRANDAGYRFGGDEILLVLTDTDGRAVADIHDRLRDAGAPAASIGSACYPVDADDAEQLIELADRRLYASKRARSAVTAFDQRRPRAGWRLAATAAAAALLTASATGAGVALLSHRAGNTDTERAPVARGPVVGSSAPAQPRQVAPTAQRAAKAGAPRRTTARHVSPVPTSRPQPSSPMPRQLPVRLPAVPVPVAVSAPPVPAPASPAAGLVQNTVHTVGAVLSDLLCLVHCGQR
ncbi:MAG TPA: GGDEF domain-containing protein [Mycobacteriales bacterium]|nr:GGDEF domain-containing protein [Mycobacteriales bacterium]